MLANDTHLTERDLHITLAALRFMQAHLPHIPEEIRAIVTNEGELPLPEAEQIDRLCELINFDLPKIPDSRSSG